MFQEKSQFQARSGRVVKVGEDGSLIFDHVNGFLGVEAVFDAAEYFEAEGDREIGRWRWAQNPSYVGYPGGDADHVRIIDERTGRCEDFTRGEDAPWPMQHAAEAYFEAHPAPTLWADAKVGEIWAVGRRGVDEIACHVVNPDRLEGEIAFLPVTRFGTQTWFIPSPSIVTAARKLWGPEA